MNPATEVVTPPGGGPWLSVPGIGADSPVVLVLPFAGGGRSFLREWERFFAPWACLGFVNLPGRDLRFREPAIDDIDVLIPLLADACAPLVADRRYALFGHSMGALIGYELAGELRARGLQEPCHLVVSGLCSPDTPLPGKPLADVSDAELLAELAQIMDLGAGEAPVRSLIAAMLPTARADFTLCERYRWRPRPRLTAGITALWSGDDPLTTKDGVAAWSRHTTGGFQARRFSGPHFFIRDHGATVAAELASHLFTPATRGP